MSAAPAFPRYDERVAMSTILIALDLSAATEAILDRATGLARVGDRLVLLHVAPPEPDFIPYTAGPRSVRKLVADELRGEHRRLLELVDGLQQAGYEAEGHMVQGATVDTIVAEAEGRGADLVVAGTRGLGKLAQLLVGSTTDGLLKRLSVPLLVVPPGPDQPA